MAPRFEPYIRNESPGRKMYCRCGRSANQPYCDGSHRDTEFTPIPADIDTEKTVAWCACRQSSNLPFCDGTHASLSDPGADADAKPDGADGPGRDGGCGCGGND